MCDWQSESGSVKVMVQAFTLCSLHVTCLVRVSHVSDFTRVCLEEENEAVLPQWGFLRDVQVPKTLAVRSAADGLKVKGQVYTHSVRASPLFYQPVLRTALGSRYYSPPLTDEKTEVHSFIHSWLPSLICLLWARYALGSKSQWQIRKLHSESLLEFTVLQER